MCNKTCMLAGALGAWCLGVHELHGEAVLPTASSTRRNLTALPAPPLPAPFISSACIGAHNKEVNYFCYTSSGQAGRLLLLRERRVADLVSSVLLTSEVLAARPGEGHVVLV